jgi:hypothetical protein
MLDILVQQTAFLTFPKITVPKIFCAVCILNLTAIFVTETKRSRSMFRSNGELLRITRKGLLLSLISFIVSINGKKGKSQSGPA